MKQTQYINAHFNFMSILKMLSINKNKKLTKFTLKRKNGGRASAENTHTIIFDGKTHFVFNGDMRIFVNGKDIDEDFNIEGNINLSIKDNNIVLNYMGVVIIINIHPTAKITQSNFNTFNSIVAMYDKAEVRKNGTVDLISDTKRAVIKFDKRVDVDTIGNVVALRRGHDTTVYKLIGDDNKAVARIDMDNLAFVYSGSDFGG